MFKPFPFQNAWKHVVAASALAAASIAGAQSLSIATSNPGSIYHGSGQVLAKLLTEQEIGRAHV